MASMLLLNLPVVVGVKMTYEMAEQNAFSKYDSSIYFEGLTKTTTPHYLLCLDMQ
jgi:hypothetical protein